MAENLKTILFLIISVSSGFICHRFGDRRLTTQKMDDIFENYMRAVKKLSADFPNHQIELHLDIAAPDIAPRLRPARRLNYINLRKPEYSTGYRRQEGAANGVDVTKTPQMLKTPIISTTDPDMQPVYVKDLNKAIQELERKLTGLNGPSAAQSNMKTDVNMKAIMQLLEKGTLVARDVPKPTDENMNWLQIKIPKK